LVRLLIQGEYNMFNYRGSTALVTGASKGIGAVFAEHLAARGMNLVLVARSLDALESLAKRLSDKHGVQCVALNADLADPDTTNWIANELERRGIQVDLLINNAGLGLSGSLPRTCGLKFNRGVSPRPSRMLYRGGNCEAETLSRELR
jgi:short-subunit dehydrogenase